MPLFGTEADAPASGCDLFTVGLLQVSTRGNIMKNALYYIEQLRMEPHPEGGFFREYLQGREIVPIRGEGDQNIYSSIFFLLREGEVSHLHRIHCDEVWYFHDGEPLTIYMLSTDGALSERVLGLEVEKGQMPQIVVPAGTWFGAAMKRPGFSLVGCMCAPCFRYDRFELMTESELRTSFPHCAARLAALVPDGR